MKPIISFIILVFISGCFSNSIETSDPEKSYTYWAGQPPIENIKVLKGKYWKSPHWTYEFEVFLNIQADKEWKLEFIKQNNLQPSYQHFTLPNNSPEWFRPNTHYQLLTPNGNYTGPFYFEDSVTNDIFIYESQL